MLRLLIDFFWGCLGNPSNLNAQAAADDLYRGNCWYEMGDYDKAIGDYNRALALVPNCTDALINRGLAWKMKGNFDKAIADYDQALALNPKSAQAFINRGNAWTDKGDYDKAIADFDQALAINPKYAKAYSNRGNVWIKKGEYDVCFRRACVSCVALRGMVDCRFTVLWRAVNECQKDTRTASISGECPAAVYGVAKNT